MTRIPAFLKSYSDSSFTNPHQVALPETPRDCRGDFTHMGAKYWGFETKRHVATSINATLDGFKFNANGHHWLYLGLAFRAKITKLTISTKWFTGNQVPIISVLLTDNVNGKTTQVVTKEKLAPDAEHQFDIDPTWATDCKVLCYHEGGISQVSLFGEQGAPLYQQDNLLEHAEISHISNEHYGRPADAALGKREQDYMFGWESARTGFGEHALFKLQQKTNIATIIVDTYLHRLNPPLSCHIFGADLSKADLASLSTLPTASLPQWKIVFPDHKEIVPNDFRDYMSKQSYLELGYSEFEIKLHLPDPSIWKPLVSFGQLYPDTWHEYNEMETKEAMNAIYYMHFPHGGIHGLKIYSS